MNTTGNFAGFPWPRMGMRIFAPLLALFFAVMPSVAQQDTRPAFTKLTREQLQQLVAPSCPVP